MSTRDNSLHDDHAIWHSIDDAENFEEEDDFDLENWSLEDYMTRTNWNIIEHDNWRLGGTGEEKSYCADWTNRGCKHTEDHYKDDHKMYVEHYQWHCKNRFCNTCFEKWIARGAESGQKMILAYMNKTRKMNALLRPIHTVLSIPDWEYEKDFEDLKKKARKILKQIGIRGGCLLYHPFRFHKIQMCWYFSPHFHSVCFGYIPKGKITTAYYETDWVIKYLGPRRSVFNTFYYLFAHCGVKKGVTSISWFGELSYGKIKRMKVPNHTCPGCSRRLVGLSPYDGDDDPPFVFGQKFKGFVPAKGFHETRAQRGEESKTHSTTSYLYRSKLTANSKQTKLDNLF